MNFRKVGATIVLLGVTVTTLSFAQTFIDRNHPGQECVRRTDFSTRPDYYGNRARNDSGSIETFYCPVRITESLVLQDPANEAAFATLVPDTINVVAWVEDWSGVSNVDCNLRICDADETDCFTSDTDSSSGSAGTLQQLVFELDSAPLALGAGQTANLACDVPAKTGGGDRSSINAYFVQLTE